jgi:hypothetical protein
MNLELRISRAIVRALSQYSAARHSAWLQRVARARMKQARFRRLPLG